MKPAIDPPGFVAEDVVGRTVLVSDERYTDPANWFLAVVLWADRFHAVVERISVTAAGAPARSLVEPCLIRACGEMADLYAYRRSVKGAFDAVSAAILPYEEQAWIARNKGKSLLDRTYGSTQFIASAEDR